MEKNLVEGLVNEHYDILQKDEEIKQQLMKELVENNMTEFFYIDWKKLHRTFTIKPQRKGEKWG